MGLILPDSIPPGLAQIGADQVGETDCLDLDPTNCAGAMGVFPAVDASLSRVVPLNVAGRPDTYYFTMRGSGVDDRLCSPGQSVELFKVVAPGAGMPDSDRVVFTLEGLDAVSSAVPGFPSDAFLDTSGQALAVDEYLWAVRSVNALVRLIVKPTSDIDVWEILLDAATYVRDATFGVVVPPGTTVAQVVGCDPGNASVPQIPPPANVCAQPGTSLPSDDQVDRDASWTAGPGLSAPHRSDVLYFHVMGAGLSAGFDPAINELNVSIKLGNVVIDGSDGNPPLLTLEGADLVSPSGTAFYEADAGSVAAGQVAVTHAGGLSIDADGDGVVDDSDHCIYGYDPDNLDRGGLLFPIPDGVGDVCQCGEAHGSAVAVEDGGGVVDNADVELLQDVLTGESTDPERELRCSVSGDNACNMKDVVVLELATDGPSTPDGPGIEPVCPRVRLLPPAPESAATPPTLYHSPGDTGVDPGDLVPALPNTGSRTVFLYLDPGPTSTINGEEMCEAGAGVLGGDGDEVCGVHFQVHVTGGLSIADFVPERSGARWRNTGTVLTAAVVTTGDPIPSGPTRVGTLEVDGAGGTGELDLLETVDASLDLGTGGAREIFFVPEPHAGLLIAVGLAGLAALARLRAARHRG